MDPQCPYEAQCGGCHWLAIPYEQQLEAKRGFVVDAFRRTAGLEVPDSIVHASAPTHYRNRVLLRGTLAADGTISVGFFARASHQQVPIGACRNVDPLINKLIAYLRSSQLPSLASEQKFRLEVQVLPALVSLNQPHLLSILHPIQNKSPLGPLLQALKDYPDMAWGGYQDEVLKAPPFLFEEDVGLRFYTAPGLFQQVNVPLNQKVRRILRDFAGENAVHSVLDLFCGSGNLSLALADGKRKVLGVEQVHGAIAMAKHNVRENKRNARYISVPADRFLGEQLALKTLFDLVIVDPPRRGMKEGLEALLNLQPAYIAYLSCDPMTLSRDLLRLKEKYEIRTLHVLDFFPNTYHVETLAILHRRDDTSAA